MAQPTPDAPQPATQADPRADLRVAWDEMLGDLAKARDAVDHPRRHPPPPSDRNLAEGYRYLAGFLFAAVERAFHEDPRFPTIRRAIQPINRSTIDNSDAIYFSAPIDGERSYLVRGRAQDFRHWRGEPRAEAGRKAPQYAIFEVASGYAGDSGSLEELRPGSRARTGFIDSTDLLVEPDGGFEILLAPERPAGHRGNFIPTKKASRNGKVHTATYLSGRELFYDWGNEDALELQITCLDAVGEHPPAFDAATCARQIRRMGELVRNPMWFWNEFYAVVLETYGDMNGDGKRFMPRNALNDPNPASIATGGGQATNVYAGGVYELAPDEALVVESRIPVPPQYVGFHLSNLWGESLDYANHQSSLNGFQAERDADGAFRYVIAHRDPGVANWLDTTGLPEGFMALRWSYSKLPGELPTTKVVKVAFDAIESQLPPGARTVSPAERRERIRIRQEHVQRRYRQY